MSGRTMSFTGRPSRRARTLSSSPRGSRPLALGSCRPAWCAWGIVRSASSAGSWCATPTATSCRSSPLELPHSFLVETSDMPSTLAATRPAQPSGDEHSRQMMMKAVAVFPGRPGSVHLAQLAKPAVTDIPDGRGVLVRVLRVGVDGTDKEINAAEYGEAPDGDDYLITGHEGLGRVVEAGPEVPSAIAPGTLVVATVRRP